MTLYSIVIPVYNTCHSLKEIVERIDIVFSKINEVCQYEIIFIDDASQNLKTWTMLESLASKKSGVRAIRFMRNFGQQAATICGLKVSKGDFVITMDDDLQHPPEAILKLITQKKHDIVIGQFSNKKHSFFKRLASHLKGYFDFIILGKPKGIQLSPYRLINRKTVNGILKMANTSYPFIPAMMFYVTKDIVGVEVEHHERKEGKTGYNLAKMIKIFSNLIINNSSFLLKLIGKLGFYIALISILYALYLIYRRIFNDIEVIGWTSVIVTVLFIGGLLLFSVGVIGEYLIRIIEGVERKPTYIIRDDLE